MKPRSSQKNPQADLFKVRLDDLCSPDHALCKVSTWINWEALEKEVSESFASTGAPGLPVRLMAGLMYLQHAYGVSDERVVEHWLESPYWQYFCGETFFQHRFPCHPTSLTKWRQRLGEAGCESLLAQTIEAGLKSKALKKRSLDRVVVDTTVQEKNVAHPTDARLLNGSRQRLVQLAHELGIQLRQTYEKAGRRLCFKVGRYGHAKQFKRLRRCVKQLKNHLGRVYRDLHRKMPDNLRLNKQQQQVLSHAMRLYQQEKKSKNKLYSLHSPEVECIAKGKAHKRYEFGVKASIATTLKECFVVGARSYPGNPYDGHTLSDQLEQTSILSNHAAKEVYVDRGYRGHKHPGKTKVIIAGQKRGITARQQKRLKRRNTVEPVIGHLKQDGKLGRCYLKGQLGDAINVILCGAGHNIRKLLAWAKALLLFWVALLRDASDDRGEPRTLSTC